jgi:hypothetical protein
MSAIVALTAQNTVEVSAVHQAPIEFVRFGIEPPSVVGFVTVEDEGTLEFKLEEERLLVCRVGQLLGVLEELEESGESSLRAFSHA